MATVFVEAWQEPYCFLWCHSEQQTWKCEDFVNMKMWYYRWVTVDGKVEQMMGFMEYLVLAVSFIQFWNKYLQFVTLAILLNYNCVFIL